MQRLTLLILLSILLFASSCSQLNKATDLLTNPSAKERYQRDFNISEELFGIWNDQAQLAFKDSVQVNLPYFQVGHIQPRSFPIFSYNIDLKTGEKLDVTVETDSLSSLVFLDLYYSDGDSLRTFKKITSAAYGQQTLSKEIEQSGIYKVIIQPEIEASAPISIKIKSSPVYLFPVVGAKNNSIQSFWGANRDGGRRSHEGIDIFAPRGTPVIAVTNGRISSSGERGLGGKQVWIRDPQRNQSLYYAHLDSIAPRAHTSVKRGDTIGFVGNTGNARTTPPHLHFGIYKGYRGAIDPLPHVFQLDEPNFNLPGNLPESRKLVTRSIANLRDQPTTRNSQIIGNSAASDTLSILGKATEWFHIRTSTNQAAFIHESLVTPI